MASEAQIEENDGGNEKNKDVETEGRGKSNKKPTRDDNVGSKVSDHSGRLVVSSGGSELTLSFEGKVYVFNGVTLDKVQAVLSYLGGNGSQFGMPVMVDAPQHPNLSRRFSSLVRFREKRKERGLDKKTRHTTHKVVAERADSKNKGCNLELNDTVQKEADSPLVMDTYLETKVPKLGMVFQSDDQAYDYYNRYARSLGFSVRRSSSTHRSDRTVSKRIFCCSKEGKYRCHSRGPPKKPRSQTRTDCKACFAVKLQGDGNYSLVDFIEEHNHELVPPSEVHILRSHRRVLGSERRHAAVGGSQDLNNISSSCANCLWKKSGDISKKRDAHFLLDYFKYMQKESPYFFYSMKMDENNQMCACFWCDAKSRVDYSFFGDVICLDTRHRISDYDMPYVLFVGVNNHGQPVLFACAVLFDETKESLVWSFESFLDAMNEKQPKTIFTDQSPPLIDAVREVLPNTYHRLCLRHIHQNAVNYLSNVIDDSGSFMKEFKSCMYAHETEEEFQFSWDALLEKHNLAQNDWLQGLYDTREKWAQVYGREQFSAGVTTTQRSEVMDDYLKRYFKRHMPVQDIVTQYEKALSHRRGKERDEDFTSRRTKPNLRTTWPVEVRAAERYTAKLFALFQEEYVHTLDLFVDATDEDGTMCIYKVSSFENIKPRTVVLDSLDDTVKCSCKKFEMMGILCAHALKVLHSKQVTDLPSQYYLNRWTKEARDGVLIEYHGKSAKVDFFSSFTLLYTDLAYIALTIAVKAASTESSCTFAKGLLIRVLEELDSFLKFDSDNSTALEDAVLTLRPLKKPKGKVSGKIKGTKEKEKRNGKTQARPTGTDGLSDPALLGAAAPASRLSVTSDIPSTHIPATRSWNMPYTEGSIEQVEQNILPQSDIDGSQYGLMSGGWNVQHSWQGEVAPRNGVGYPGASSLEALSLRPTRPLSMPQMPYDKGFIGFLGQQSSSHRPTETPMQQCPPQSLEFSESTLHR